jgi:predicted  nucleic acid-binding Zn-ribbon protein
MLCEAREEAVMAKTLAERVEVLERELSAVKSKIDRAHDRIDTIDADIQNIPDLIKLESRLMDSRFSRLQSEMDRFKDHLDERFDAVIPAIAEVMAEHKSRS